MGRTKTEISKETLIQTINEVESNDILTNRSELANRVADKLGITASVVILRIKEFNIEPKTPKGKRGRINFDTPVTRISKKEKFASLEAQKVFVELISNIPQEFQKKSEYKNLLKKAKTGSVKAFIKLKCLDCCCHVKSEVRNCIIKSCPLYLIRGYQ